MNYKSKLSFYINKNEWIKREKYKNKFNNLKNIFTLYWIPDKSHILPQIPSKASISLTRCPFPIPPKEGLQDISPEKFKFDSVN